jgi:hypothetical protein
MRAQRSLRSVADRSARSAPPLRWPGPPTRPRRSCEDAREDACAARSRRTSATHRPRHPRAPCAQARLPGSRSWPCIPGTWPSPAPHPAENLRRTAPGPACREDQVPPATRPPTRPPPTDPRRRPCRRPARSPAEPGWPGRRSRPESAWRPAPVAPPQSRAPRTRRVYPTDGGILPLHRYHPLSLTSWYSSCDLSPARGPGPSWPGPQSLWAARGLKGHPALFR